MGNTMRACDSRQLLGFESMSRDEGSKFTSLSTLSWHSANSFSQECYCISALRVSMTNVVESSSCFYLRCRACVLPTLGVRAKIFGRCQAECSSELVAHVPIRLSKSAHSLYFACV